jgi:hypothetical protein
MDRGMSDPEELSRSLAYKECGVSDGQAGYLLTPFEHLPIPFSGELRVAA